MCFKERSTNFDSGVGFRASFFCAKIIAACVRIQFFREKQPMVCAKEVVFLSKQFYNSYITGKTRQKESTQK